MEARDALCCVCARACVCVAASCPVEYSSGSFGALKGRAGEPT